MANVKIEHIIAEIIEKNDIENKRKRIRDNKEN